MQQTKMSNKKSTYVLKDRFCPLKRLFTNKAKVINATKAIGARCCANTIRTAKKIKANAILVVIRHSL